MRYCERVENMKKVAIMRYKVNVMIFCGNHNKNSGCLINNSKAFI